MKRIRLLAIGVCLALTLYAQEEKKAKNHDFVHQPSKTYEWPTDPKVLKKLDQWQDAKFGVFFHWGIYSVSGCHESWGLCAEERFNHRRKSARDVPYDEFKKWYWEESESFNPTQFDPKDWANTMTDAGFKYLLFTTKHHDGFCMFDSKYTDYNIAQGPYKDGKYSNVAYHLFDAFRKKGLMIGAYFSKPDWHSEDFWNPNQPTPDRNPNYDIKNNTKKWAKFQKFTANQIDELMSDYGSIDVLWLDGGWVKKPKYDILLDKIVDEARIKQPGLIVADRTVAGRNENYQTPERRIPPKQVANPWESCLTLTDKWGWKPNAKYQSSTWVINTLAEITAKGGNMALGIGPKADGTFEEKVLVRLKQVGAWLNQNGEAIYATRITPNYNYGNVWFTANKDGKTLYAIYALPEKEKLPANIEWEGNEPVGKMMLLQNKQPVKYTCKEGKVIVTLPEGLKQETLAFSFKIK